MQPLAIHPRLLREAAGGGLTLTPGRGVMARVLAVGAGGRGALAIAGLMIEAQLPAGVRAGESLRLVVRSLEEHRVVLALDHESESGAAGHAATPAAPATPATPPPPVPLPGGGRLHLRGEEDPDDPAAPRRAGAPPRAATLALRYEAPALGALDLSFTLDPGSLRLQIAAGAGPGYGLTREHADALRDALEQALGRAATVTVVPRREPLDVYA